MRRRTSSARSRRSLWRPTAAGWPTHSRSRSRATTWSTASGSGTCRRTRTGWCSPPRGPISWPTSNGRPTGPPCCRQSGIRRPVTPRRARLASARCASTSRTDEPPWTTGSPRISVRSPRTAVVCSGSGRRGTTKGTLADGRWTRGTTAGESAAGCRSILERTGSRSPPAATSHERALSRGAGHMSVGTGTSRLRAWAIVVVLALAGGLCNPPPASAATLRLRVLDFNACDQFGRGNAACDATPTQRASAIVASINSFAPNVVTLQEVCRSTVDMAVASLGPAWKAQFFSTFTTTDARCQSVDHTWGIAVLARSPVLTNPQSFTLGVETSGEVRTLLCIDVAVGLAVRACTTHLTSGSNANAAVQSNKAVDQVNPWTTANTVLVGGDFNLNVRACGNTDVSTGLRGWYSTRFGAGVTRCYTGVGSMYEVDQYRAGGDGVYDETTLGSVKIDFVFGNRQHVNADVDGDATSSSLSDHDPLRGAVTAHD